jgi:hypothetical protein
MLTIVERILALFAAIFSFFTLGDPCLFLFGIVIAITGSIPPYFPPCWPPL